MPINTARYQISRTAMLRRHCWCWPGDIGGVVAFLCPGAEDWINAQRIEGSGGMNL